MFQRKEQDKTLEEISNVEIDNLPERVQSIDCKYDQRTWEKNAWPEKWEVFNEDLENIPTNQTELKNRVKEKKKKNKNKKQKTQKLKWIRTG